MRQTILVSSDQDRVHWTPCALTENRKEKSFSHGQLVVQIEQVSGTIPDFDRKHSDEWLFVFLAGNFRDFLTGKCFFSQ
jgi:hypothetical protein